MMSLRNVRGLYGATELIIDRSNKTRSINTGGSTDKLR